MTTALEKLQALRTELVRRASTGTLTPMGAMCLADGMREELRTLEDELDKAAFERRALEIKGASQTRPRGLFSDRACAPLTLDAGYTKPNLFWRMRKWLAAKI